MCYRGGFTLVLFAGEGQTNASVDFGGIEFATTSMFDRKTPAWLMRKVVAKAAKKDLMLIRICSVAAFLFSPIRFRWGNSPPSRPSDGSGFPACPFTRVFHAGGTGSAGSGCAEICASYDKVIVSSECAGADLRAFSPRYAHKAELLRFVTNPMSLSDCTSLKELQRVYRFERAYFILPNQFRAHKNHRVVITALQILKKGGKSAVVLATGSTKDYRNPAVSLSHAIR